MSLSDFLRLLGQQDNITIHFSHLGYVVRRGDIILDQRGNHEPVKPVTSAHKIRKTANMYCSLSVAMMYCSDDLRSMFGDVMATLNPLYKERR